MIRLHVLLAATVLLGSVSPVASADAERLDNGAILPPVIPWDGESRKLVVPESDPWITPSEKSGLTETPRYNETMAWIERLVEASPELRRLSIGSG